jgi:hypothetical protein
MSQYFQEENERVLQEFDPTVVFQVQKVASVTLEIDSTGQYLGLVNEECLSVSLTPLVAIMVACERYLKNFHK